MWNVLVNAVSALYNCHSLRADITHWITMSNILGASQAHGFVALERELLPCFIAVPWNTKPMCFFVAWIIISAGCGSSEGTELQWHFNIILLLNWVLSYSTSFSTSILIIYGNNLHGSTSVITSPSICRQIRRMMRMKKLPIDSRIT